MKHFFILILFTLLLTSCGRSKNEPTTWIIEKTTGEMDTVLARDYWILSPDSIFIKFEIDDTTKVIYNRQGVVSFRKIY